MTGSKDLPPSEVSFLNVFWYNQFRAKPQWPSPNTDLSEKTAIVTGSNTGLGYEAASQLLGLKLGHLIMAVRSIEKGQAAAAKLKKLHPKAKIDVWPLDMSSYKSIEAFVQRTQTELERLDMALLNAGLNKMNFALKSTGHEETIQVNYLSTMLLTILLLPILKEKCPPEAKPAHISIASAALSLIAKFPQKEANPLLPSFDDAATYDPQDRYNTSKVLAHMFLWNLVDYVPADQVIINLTDPAFCKGTSLHGDAPMGLVILLKIFGALTGRTPKVGASCLVDGMVNKGEESHGCFLMSWEIHPFAAFLYTDEGKKVTQRVWDETLAEFEFAGAKRILESMKDGT